jgi:hypothetical protein
VAWQGGGLNHHHRDEKLKKKMFYGQFLVGTGQKIIAFEGVLLSSCLGVDLKCMVMTHGRKKLFDCCVLRQQE